MGTNWLLNLSLGHKGLTLASFPGAFYTSILQAIKNWRNRRPGNDQARLTHLLPFVSKMCSCLPYSGFLSGEKTFVNFAFLWWFVKVLSVKSTYNRFQTPWNPGTSYVTAPMCKSSLPLTMFAYFQRAYSVLPNSDGPLLTAAPVSWQSGLPTGRWNWY